MFFSVIIAYVVAAVFAFCGAVNTVSCFMDAQREEGYFRFIADLSVAMWPLAVAVIILMLVQIACKLERWMLLWTISSSGKGSGSTTHHVCASAHAQAQAQAPAPFHMPGSEPLPVQPTTALNAPEPKATNAPKSDDPKQEGLSFFKLD